MSKERLQYLMDRFDTNEILEEEFRELFAFVKDADNKSDFEKVFIRGLKQQQSGEIDQEKFNRILQRILHSSDNAIPMIPERKVSRWWRIAVAAVFILLSGGAYLWLNQQPQKNIGQQSVQDLAVSNDVSPGSNKAILTLADGSAVVLDSAADGMLALQGNIKVLKSGHGKLVYEADGAVNAKDILYNTVSTPRGGQYQVTLPDGTKVWLNAASSLFYPTAFVGKERNVELTGEGYFEVAKNTAMPFHVKVKGLQVEVLGTHFNVMAYDNESTVKTTLLEGSVRLYREGKTALLSPGQQAQLDNKGEIKLVKDADIELAVAWKNGYTSFKSADIKGIMRQVERWYDVEVVYEGNISVRSFTGEVPRDVNLSQLIKILKVSNIDLSIEGKKIIVRP